MSCGKLVRLRLKGRPVSPRKLASAVPPLAWSTDYSNTRRYEVRTGTAVLNPNQHLASCSRPWEKKRAPCRLRSWLHSGPGGGFAARGAIVLAVDSVVASFLEREGAPIFRGCGRDDKVDVLKDGGKPCARRLQASGPLCSRSMQITERLAKCYKRPGPCLLVDAFLAYSHELLLPGTALSRRFKYRWFFRPLVPFFSFSFSRFGRV